MRRLWYNAAEVMRMRRLARFYSILLFSYLLFLLALLLVLTGCGFAAEAPTRAPAVSADLDRGEQAEAPAMQTDGTVDDIVNIKYYTYYY